MFKVGSYYEFKMLDGGDEITFWGTVEKYEHPLIKLEDHDNLAVLIGETTAMSPKVAGKIINVTSPSFICAVEKSKS